MLLFHATPATNLPSITQNGLIPTLDGPQAVVHLADDPALAHSSCLYEGPEEVVVLTVDASGLPLLPGYDGPGTHYTTLPIPPSRITR